MNPEDQITAIRDILSDDVFAIDKVNRIEDIIPPITPAPITIADLSAAQDESYTLGYHAGRGSTFNIMLVWGIICGVGGVVIGMAVI